MSERTIEACKWDKEIMSRCKATWPEGDEVWLEKRKGTMTATKAVAAVGLSTFASPMDIYQEWTDPDYKPDFTPSQRLRMKIGLAAEEHILEAAERHSERPGSYVQFKSEARLVGHPAFDWASCSPDGFAMSPELGRVVLEVKNTNIGTKGQYTTEDGQECCPPAYRAQVVWNMACTGADCGVLIANFNGNLVFRLIARDEEEIEFIFGEARKFIDACEGDNKLAIFDLIQKGTMRWDAVKKLYNQVEDDGVSIVDNELDTLVADYLSTDVAFKELGDRHKFLKSRIAERVGGHRRMETGAYRISWGQNPGRERFDIELFKERNPSIDMQEYYTRSGPFRTGMRISKVKEAR